MHHACLIGIVFDSYSGWSLVMTLPQFKEGVIITKMITWHGFKSNVLTKDWASIDNKGRRNMRRSTISNATSFSIVSKDYEASEICGERSHHQSFATISIYSFPLRE